MEERTPNYWLIMIWLTIFQLFLITMKVFKFISTTWPVVLFPIIITTVVYGLALYLAVISNRGDEHEPTDNVE